MCSYRGNLYAVIKEVLHINEGLELGSVRPPMPGLVSDDLPKVSAVAEVIRHAVEQYT